MNTHRLPSVLASLFASFLILGTGHAQKADRKATSPKPDIANEHYGPNERNVLDLYKAKSDSAEPIVVSARNDDRNIRSDPSAKSPRGCDSNRTF